MSAASKDTLIVADGFSCREQIEQLTDRHALQPAQVLKMARESGPQGPSGNFPETEYLEDQSTALKPLEIALIADVAIRAIGWLLRSRHD